MKKINILICLCGLVVISGCATIKPIELKANDKIGVYVNVSNDFSSFYRGFTVFNNESNNLKLNLVRISNINKLIERYKSGNIDFELKNQLKGRNLESLTEQAKSMKYDYLLYIHDGFTCLDGYCNNVSRGIGIRGAVFHGYSLTSNIAYEIIDIRTKETKYSRMVDTYVGLDSIDYDENWKNYNIFIKSIYCLDNENIKMAMWEMNRISPLFKIEKQNPMSSSDKLSLSEIKKCAIQSQ